MNLKRLTRGPFLWVLLAVVLIWIGMSTLASPKISKIDTSDGFALLQGTTVEQAKMTDGDQRVDLTLTKDFVVGDDNLGSGASNLCHTPVRSQVRDFS